MEAGACEGIHEHATIDTLTQEAGGPDESVEVLGEVHQSEDEDSLAHLQLVAVNEDLTSWEQSHPEHFEEPPDNVHFL